MNLGLSIELRPSRVKLFHVSQEDSVEFVVDRGSGFLY